MTKPRASIEDIADQLDEYISSRQPGVHPTSLIVPLSDGRKIVFPLRATGAATPDPARHSIDFRSAHWYGTAYSFTANQAAAIRVLWDAWQNETPEVSGETLLEATACEAEEVRHLFRDHPAWGTMIASPRRGVYRLEKPASRG